MSLPLYKLIFAAIVFATGGLGVSIPWILQTKAPHERVRDLGNAFSAGVLGGAGLIHLLDAAVTGFRAAAPGLTFPLAFVLAGGGFQLILLIEEVIVSHPEESGHSAHGALTRTDHGEGAGALPFVLLLVLSIHSVIVGTALGAQHALGTAAIVFAAVMAHKATAGFALGVAYQRAGFTPRQTLPEAALFASMTPLGILIGTGISSLTSSTGALWFESVFDSLGAGTFIYIATLDILRTEFDRPGDRWQKWLATTLGFGTMAIVAIWI